MASRGRVALIALGVGAAVLVAFVVTIWLLIAVTDDGLPGGAKVAVVEVEGIIGADAPRGLDTDGVVRVLGEYRDDPAVRAVVLRINSPGGVVAPTQEIFTAVRRLREAKKPVVASLGSVAASGGYYVAVAADRIYASPGTLTGSIGVVMQLANLEGLLKKVGVEYVVVKAGAYKDVVLFLATAGVVVPMFGANAAWNGTFCPTLISPSVLSVMITCGVLITFTSLELSRAWSTIPNDGTLTPPTVIGGPWIPARKPLRLASEETPASELRPPRFVPNTPVAVPALPAKETSLCSPP